MTQILFWRVVNSAGKGGDSGKKILEFDILHVKNFWKYLGKKRMSGTIISSIYQNGVCTFKYGLYSPTILENILCLFLQDLQIGM